MIESNGNGVRNREWFHMLNRDVISMPDKWEYPWYAAWDLAFHRLPRLAEMIELFRKRHPELINQVAATDERFIGHNQRRSSRITTSRARRPRSRPMSIAPQPSLPSWLLVFGFFTRGNSMAGPCESQCTCAEDRPNRSIAASPRSTIDCCTV
jgi:hypothetical protein